jgi:hypothetical protein
MIDIETLSTRRDAVVLSVGCCLFTRTEVHKPYEFACDVQQQLDGGRRIDSSTLSWWMSQGDEARKMAFNPEPQTMLMMGQAGAYLRDLITHNNVDAVWAHGVVFDLGILEDYLGMSPWDFRNIRDTRTLASISPGLRPQPLTPHSAGSDAEAQAHWVISMEAGLCR